MKPLLSPGRTSLSTAVGVPNRRDCCVAFALEGWRWPGCSGKGKRRIAVIPKATSHMFWLTVQKGAFDAGREFNVRFSGMARPAKRISAGRSRLSIR